MAFLSLFLPLASPFVGSFITASANCWPNWRQIFKTRSICSSCQQQLQNRDLIPVISYLLLRAKCRHCAEPIGWQHLFAELVAILIALAAIVWFDGWMMLVTALFGWVLLFASLVDYRLKLLPDGATLGLVIAGLLLQYLQVGTAGLWLALLGAIIGFAAFFAVSKLYRILRGREGLGLGDAKLLAAGGAWCGPFALSWIVLLAASLALAGLMIRAAINRQKLTADTALGFGPALATAIFVMWLLSSNGLG
ncbi:Leader peptidase (Prepilin peptidase) / N-methyltransferase [hydrothermal vent metagenome]|uniref:Leader peptidase (Prepilin peptidase) / N-methyltransferase n=1 Tax=hydrothermal vent metagenome TaxID=652676 RepID=A0A3B0RFH4_9ZZZZ